MLFAVSSYVSCTFWRTFQKPCVIGQILKLLDLYQNKPVIWDPTHSYHNDKKNQRCMGSIKRTILECIILLVDSVEKKEKLAHGYIKGPFAQKNSFSEIRRINNWYLQANMICLRIYEVFSSTNLRMSHIYKYSR